jgi:outer membrane biosynthesis protein TonB
MFGWLALNLIVSSHHGAVLRMLLRAWNGEQRSSAPVRRRVAASDGSVQVRVKTSELAPEETVAGTDVEVSEPEPEKGRERARRVR